ncbi:RagB/SusD family nutrient uptake outer membrane protein [Paraflavitalea pollutisoli]|uniref:RagB/SusD family nutrient uptake outer membrane protein n=1 Tax=Paraflavitalea pollutisoli TaxID=3034143 RepID=UPI0023EC652A|nr:RagB/SusD family nutrient uptake outer membrane protein [Paraflavitalea sp. H1-2-19X]
MKKYLFIITLAAFSGSCNKWLDVKPEDAISKEELFKTESGFLEAINGVYTAAANEQLYGVELSAGLPDALAQSFHLEPNDRNGYYQAAQYNYQDGHAMSRISSIWGKTYNAIANCNLILENINNSTPMLPVNKALVEGEALALRAYLHFDMLRLFGPSFATAPAGKSIPYVTSYSNKVTPLSTVTEALNLMVTDLIKAKEILKRYDPILTEGYKVGYPGDTASKEQQSQVLFQQNRRHRLNYYAVCGTLARVYLYLDKKAEALANAQEVITAGKFPWTKAADFIQSDITLKDRILYPEILFGWFADRYENSYLSRFESGAAGLFIALAAGDNLYETGGVGGEDLRLKHWFTMVKDNSISRYELVKYKRDKETNRHPLVLPAIRLSEMYYIAAETTWDTDPAKALSYLNTVRRQRGIISDINTADKQVFVNELVKEVRKETYAEGQIFYLYKRLNRGIVQESGAVLTPSNKVFVLPLPNDELEYGQR